MVQYRSNDGWNAPSWILEGQRGAEVDDAELATKRHATVVTVSATYSQTRRIDVGGRHVIPTRAAERGQPSAGTDGDCQGRPPDLDHGSRSRDDRVRGSTLGGARIALDVLADESAVRGVYQRAVRATHGHENVARPDLGEVLGQEGRGEFGGVVGHLVDVGEVDAMVVDEQRGAVEAVEVEPLHAVILRKELMSPSTWRGMPCRHTRSASGAAARRAQVDPLPMSAAEHLLRVVTTDALDFLPESATALAPGRAAAGAVQATTSTTVLRKPELPAPPTSQVPSSTTGRAGSNVACAATRSPPATGGSSRNAARAPLAVVASTSPGGAGHATESGLTLVDLGWFAILGGFGPPPGQAHPSVDAVQLVTSRYNDRDGNPVRADLGPGGRAPVKFVGNTTVAVVNAAYEPSTVLPFLQAAIGTAAHAVPAGARDGAQVDAFGNVSGGTRIIGGISEATSVPFFLQGDRPAAMPHSVVAPTRFMAPTGSHDTVNPAGANLGTDYHRYRPALVTTYLGAGGPESDLGLNGSIDGTDPPTHYEAGTVVSLTHAAIQHLSPLRRHRDRGLSPQPSDRGPPGWSRGQHGPATEHCAAVRPRRPRAWQRGTGLRHRLGTALRSDTYGELQRRLPARGLLEEPSRRDAPGLGRDPSLNSDAAPCG